MSMEGEFIIPSPVKNSDSIIQNPISDFNPFRIFRHYVKRETALPFH